MQWRVGVIPKPMPKVETKSAQERRNARVAEYLRQRAAPPRVHLPLLEQDRFGLNRYCGKRSSPLPLGEVAERSEAGEGLRIIDSPRPPHPNPLPQPKLDLSDFGQSKIPNSGKPEFGGERELAIAVATASTRRKRALGGGRERNDAPQRDEGELRLALMQKMMLFVNPWRGCPARVCRRHRRCASSVLECTSAPLRRRSPEREEAALANFQRALARRRAEVKGMDMKGLAMTGLEK